MLNIGKNGVKIIEITSNHCPSRKQIEAMAQAEGIHPSKLWLNKRLACSYLITFSIANAARNLKDGEKALIKFPGNVEFMIKKENDQVKVNRDHLAWMLGHDIETFPFSQIIKSENGSSMS